MDLRGGVDGVEKYPCLCREWNPDYPVFKDVL
jgi:hypothetical protein